MDDWQQLMAYAQRGDGTAFEAVVKRHIGLVYSAAKRQVEQTPLAEEVVQLTFILLAKKAPDLKPTGSLGAWLYKVACQKARELQRSERSRKQREASATANSMKQQDDQAEALDWTLIAPVLDEAMDSLNEDDRTAVLMRYFEGRSHREVGQALCLSEDAARKRVARALESLRAWLQSRGIASTAGALGVALGAFAVESAPAALTQSTIQSALASGAGAATATTTSSTIATLMASMKIPIAAALLAGAAIPISLGYRTEENIASDPIVLSQDETFADPFALPDEQESALIAEWERLRKEHGPNGGTMSAFYEAVNSLDDDFRKLVFRTACLSEWTKTDPGGAFAYFVTKKNQSRAQDIFRLWLERDPDAAIEALKESGEDFAEGVEGLLEEVAKHDPTALATLAPMAKQSHRNETEKAFALAARGDLEGTRAIADALEGAARKDALAGVAKVWAERDPDAALAWAEAIEPAADRGPALSGLLVGWAKKDPVAALDHLDLAPPGGGHMMQADGSTSGRVFREAAAADFDATLSWLGENVDEVKEKRLDVSLSGELGKRFLADAPSTLELIRDHPAGELLKRELSFSRHSSDFTSCR